jgi:hypothetical protein
MGQQVDLIVHPSDLERVHSQLKLPADGDYKTTDELTLFCMVSLTV